MTIRTILRYPDPRLRTVAAPVSQVDSQVSHLVDDMFETMYASGGLGLAATQVDVHLRVVVMDVSPQRTAPQVLINPVLLERSEELVAGNEGCLSLPYISERVTRHSRVKVRALDISGAFFELDSTGIAAVCIQHEMDHLLGRVFVDHLSAVRRTRVHQKLLKPARLRASPPDGAASPSHSSAPVPTSLGQDTEIDIARARSLEG